MAVTKFSKLPLTKQLLVVKRVKTGGTLFQIVEKLTIDDPIIVTWRNGRFKILD